ncbi:hypothetical protein DL95DRAFT_466202 [Leptodontidium sp. 2 PMI_412]|nr:hypothetical protein DL95DRAFT_466202 [Leptodontidium sp. 2 PMI_412]
MSAPVPLDQTKGPEAQEKKSSVLEEPVEPIKKKHKLVEIFQSFNPEFIEQIPALDIDRLSFADDEEKEEARLAVFDLFKHVKAGSTLKRFHVTNNRTRNRTRLETDSISFDDLLELHEHCPLPEDLEIDLPMFPYKDLRDFPDRLTFTAKESLELLTSLTNLTKLSVRYHEESPREKEWKAYEDLSITLDRAFQPKNWRRPASGEPELTDAKYYWSVRKRFHSKINEKGEYEQWVRIGSDRVGEVLDESEEQRAKAEEEWLEYQETYGDLATIRRSRNLFSIGRSVYVYGEPPERDVPEMLDGDERSNESADKGKDGKLEAGNSKGKGFFQALFAEKIE